MSTQCDDCSASQIYYDPADSSSFISSNNDTTTLVPYNTTLYFDGYVGYDYICLSEAEYTCTNMSFFIVTNQTGAPQNMNGILGMGRSVTELNIVKQLWAFGDGPLKAPIMSVQFTLSNQQSEI